LIQHQYTGGLSPTYSRPTCQASEITTGMKECELVFGKYLPKKLDRVIRLLGSLQVNTGIVLGYKFLQIRIYSIFQYKKITTYTNPKEGKP
jgi:hypothetical protein